MQTFLEQLAEHHIQYHLTEIDEFCFVFPSRRAGLFFNKYLSEKTPKAVWAPKVVTINEFFEEIDSTPVADPITLLFNLHLSYQKVMQSNISIDEFLPMGEMLLSDFNDIDKYLADPKQVFANLAAIKALDIDYQHLQPEQVKAIQLFWSSFDPERLSRQQEQFLAVWEKLYILYEDFRHKLDAQGIAYSGMVLRRVAEKTRTDRALATPYKRIIFAGFNALNSCEKVIFNYLNIQGKAEFYWDYPQWILNKESGLQHVQHEATRFIKANLNDFPEPKNWKAPLPKSFPDITIAAAANDLVQAQIAHDCLKQFSQRNEEPEKTALVLADEQQLMPTMHSIPDAYQSINITLGFPLKNTPAFALVENLLAMQKTTRVTREGKTWFYHRNVLEVLRHQSMEAILEGENAELVRELIASNHLFVEGHRLTGSPLLASIFIKIESTGALTGYLNNLLMLIYKQLEKKEGTEVEREFVYFLYTSLKRLSDILSELKQEPSPDTWQMLFKRMAMQQSVPFRGEPLSGLQVMGILETRALDFDNLVVTGLNEGVFPKTSPPDSFIPFNLRKGHGLPTIDNQDAIFAYYFYRLIHRAKNVKLIYTTTKSLTEEAEMSRFLQQLYYEYPGKITMETMQQLVTIPKQPEMKASKNEQVMQILEKWTQADGRDLSPSALSIYLECPLKFYYRYVANIKEPEEISEDLDPRVFGNLFHQIVEALYKPYVGQTITRQELETVANNKTRIKEVMDSVFADNIPFVKEKTNVFNDLQGKNTLIYEIIHKYIVRFLKVEAEAAPFKLLALEEKVSGRFNLGNGLIVNIGGTIDRTDEKDGYLRILDYKTGSAKKEIDDIAKLFSQKDHAEYKAIFQTLLYSMVKKQTDNKLPIIPGVITVKTLFKENYDSNIYLKENKQKELLTLHTVEYQYAEMLQEALIQLFNKEIDFTQTDNADSCKYCIYSANCLKS